MDNVGNGQGVKLRRVSVDTHNFIEADSRIGCESAKNGRCYHVTPSSLIVVPLGDTNH